jgi:peptidoglycan-N-acetylglucosamine deacetylase
VSAAVTVDVDGLAGLACRPGGPWDGRLTARSEHEYVWRALERVVSVLDRFRARATFYVPGATIDENPAACAELLAAGHEVAHHGYHHLPTTGLDDAGQREELERGIESLARIGAAPSGYRSPGWELTPATLDELVARGFDYDSSLMGDDRPHRVAGGAIVELPVHWSLDDAPHFAATTDPAGLTRVWCDEVALAAAERRPITVTLHPEILGRPHRADVLRRVLDLARRCGLTPVRHRELAAALVS